MLQRFLFIEPAIFPVSPHAIAPNKRPQISTRCSLEQPAKADQSPNPAQANTTRLAAPPNLPPHSTIIWRAEIPFSNGHDRLPHILHRSFPNCFPSISAAKRVIRRGELFNKSSDKWHRATVLDRPHSGDLIARAARTEMASVRSRFSKKQPPLALQPDFVKFIDPKGHFAVVVKPPGVEIGKEFREATFFAVGDTIRRDETLTRQVGPVLRRPVAVHRLDKVTGGLVIVALTEKAVRSLSSQFQRREVSKTYRARVEGHLASREKLISEPVDGKKPRPLFPWFIDGASGLKFC